MAGLPARSPRVSQEIHEVKMHGERTRISQEEQELYRFGYKLLLLQAVNIAVVIAIGLAFSCLKEMMLFLIAYVPLRSYAGGYHAGGPIRCGIISAGMELAVAVVLQIPVTANLRYIALLAAALCEIIIYMTVPVAAKNKPLTDSQVISFRKKARGILILEIVFMAMMYLIRSHAIVLVIAMCHILVAGLVLVGKLSKTQS